MHRGSWFLLFRSHRCCYLLRTCDICKKRFHFLVMSGAINVESWKFIIFKREVSFLSFWSFLIQKYHVLYIRLTLYWGYLIVLWLFHLVCIFCCDCFNVFCNMWVCVCGGVLTVVWVFWLYVYLYVFTVFCIVCTVFLYCFVYVYLFLFVLSVLG